MRLNSGEMVEQQSQSSIFDPYRLPNCAFTELVGFLLQRQGNCFGPIFDVGAAPHLPAGIFSPYSDGEKGLMSEPDR